MLSMESQGPGMGKEGLTCPGDSETSSASASAVPLHVAPRADGAGLLLFCLGTWLLQPHVKELLLLSFYGQVVHIFPCPVPEPDSYSQVVRYFSTSTPRALWYGADPDAVKNLRKGHPLGTPSQ